MRLSMISLVVVSSAVAFVYASDSCDMGTIQSTLLLNGTTWHDNCASATGMDVFAMITLPTKAEAQNIFQSRDCVNYLNQLSQQANTQIQCEMQSSNKTDFSSGSMSGSASLSPSDFASVSNSSSGSESGLDSIAEPDSSIVEPGSSIAEPDSSASISVTASFTVVATTVTAVLSFAL
ncbi:unnamed protein product [Peronospora farinosa]|uniref:Elicitin n=1 Tax=Peronospora farinosa TaxID=134698 RepID=A0AAV0SST7_9STRA|nr:unnamed protein product [Peronospora farinosa]